MLDQEATHRHIRPGDFFFLKLIGVRVVVVKRAAIEDVEANRLRLVGCGLLGARASTKRESQCGEEESLR
jgi:hypothetical protein